MTRFLTRMGAMLVMGVIGLAMAFYSLERLSLISIATAMDQDDGRAPLTVQLSMFVGLMLVNVACFVALVTWSRFLRANPGTLQAPVWLLVAVLVGAGAAMVWALATHAGWLNHQAVVPMSVHWGYIAFQVVAATLLLVCVILVGVRWSPGYKPRASLGAAN